ncbi:MAG: sulfotransferase [Pseudomonadota bacterium]
MLDNLLVIVGSAKAGTTSAAAWLDQHPRFSVCSSKEPRFFSDFLDREWSGPGSRSFYETIPASLDEYQDRFAGLQFSDWAVDASTDYVWNEAATERLGEFARNRNVKLVCIVRDPVARAISEYNHTLRNKWQDLSFMQSVSLEAERRRKGYHPLFYHTRRSRVHDDIHRLSRAFGNNLLIVDFAMLSQPKIFMESLCSFVGVESHEALDFSIKNRSRLPRSAPAKALLANDRLRRLSRRIVPQKIRGAVWRGLHADAKHLKTVENDEIDQFRELMSDEIRQCLASDLIPTQNWTLAVPRAET